MPWDYRDDGSVVKSAYCSIRGPKPGTQQADQAPHKSLSLQPQDFSVPFWPLWTHVYTHIHAHAPARVHAHAHVYTRTRTHTDTE